MSPVPSRCIRAIYLLPGVKCGSHAKGRRGASKCRRRKRTVVGVVYKGGQRIYGMHTVLLLIGVMQYCTVVLLL